MRTLCLTQRRRLLQRQPTAAVDEVSSTELARWRALPAFSRSLTFQQRLESLSLHPDEAPLLFSPHLGAAAPGEDDLRQLLRLLQEWSPAWKKSAGGESAPRQAFGTFIAPLLAYARNILAERLRAVLPEAATHENISNAFLPLLHERFYAMFIRALVLELNIARLDGDRSDAAAGERLEVFLARRSNLEGARAFFERFPVLARFTLATVENWLGLSTELLARLHADRADIARLIGHSPSIPALRSVACTGDRHDGGRAVCVLEFAGGEKLVYKPRDLAVELALAELLRWIETRTTLAFRVPRTFARPTHAWVEYITHDPCESIEDAAFYYRHLGATLALAYVLSGFDLHSDNLIAHGRNPVIVDGETFFCPRGGNLVGHVDEPAGLANVGILPRIARIYGGREFDNSVLGARVGDVMNDRAARLTGKDAEGLRFAPAELLAQTVTCRPMLNGRMTEAADHLDVFIAGFTELYRLFLRERDTPVLRAQIENFRGKPIRYVARPTRVYGELLEACLHPDYCQNGFDVDLLFERLWDVSSNCVKLHRIVPDEIEQLWNLDIPMFRVRSDSTTLLTRRGTVENYLHRSGYDEVRLRIAALSEADLDRQVWVICSAIVPTPALRFHRTVAPPRRSPEETAAAIGRRIARLAFRPHGSGDFTWVDYQHSLVQKITFAPIREDLYDGIAGLAVFLAALRHVGMPEFADLEKSATAAVVRSLQQKAGVLPGGFNGTVSTLFALACVARLGGDVDVAGAWRPLLPALHDTVPRDVVFDLIAGSAGTLLSCLAAYQVSGDKTFLHLAQAAADHLLDHRVEADGGWAWICGSISQVPLTGFAHGAAGIAYALAVLHGVTGTVRYAQAAERAFAYERAHFDPARRNWADLRSADRDGHEPDRHHGSTRGMVAWCHGAPGIGLSRLACLPLLGREALRDEIAAGMEATLAAEERCPAADPTLCHGAFGRLAFLSRTSALLPEFPHADRSDTCWNVAAEALNQTLFGPQAESLPLGKLGLMRGIAGVGYEMLQKASGYRIPDVLLLNVSGLGNSVFSRQAAASSRL